MEPAWIAAGRAVQSDIELLSAKLSGPPDARPMQCNTEHEIGDGLRNGTLQCSIGDAPCTNPTAARL